MNNIFLEKKKICKEKAEKSLVFNVISEDLSFFLNSLDKLEDSNVSEKLVDSLIDYFDSEEEILEGNIN